jgi:hypothetical protein
LELVYLGVIYGNQGMKILSSKLNSRDAKQKFIAKFIKNLKLNDF